MIHFLRRAWWTLGTLRSRCRALACGVIVAVLSFCCGCAGTMAQVGIGKTARTDAERLAYVRSLVDAMGPESARKGLLAAHPDWDPRLVDRLLLDVAATRGSAPCPTATPWPETER